MTTNRDTPPGSLELARGFDALRKQLHQPQYADRLDRPLAFWAAADDRRLPWALLSRPLRAILAVPFDQLLDTPSVGPKKANSLLALLSRAAEDQATMAGFGTNHDPGDRAIAAPLTASAKFDPALVSEAMWTQWRAIVHRNGLDSVPLGRLFPALKSLPTVMWQTPLASYSNQSLHDIRKLKTHGSKRVRMILETFYSVYKLLSRVTPVEHLGVRIVPRFVPPIEQWLLVALSANMPPDADEVRQFLTTPLVRQLHHDARPVVARLAEERLGLKGSPQTVRQQAKKVSVTRARVYQLLEECSRVMEVRWPEGRPLFESLARKYREASLTSDVDGTLFRSTAELFFPARPWRGNDILLEA